MCVTPLILSSLLPYIIQVTTPNVQLGPKMIYLFYYIYLSLNIFICVSIYILTINANIYILTIKQIYVCLVFVCYFNLPSASFAGWRCCTWGESCKALGQTCRGFSDKGLKCKIYQKKIFVLHNFGFSLCMFTAHLTIQKTKCLFHMENPINWVGIVWVVKKISRLNRISENN